MESHDQFGIIHHRFHWVDSMKTNEDVQCISTKIAREAARTASNPSSCVDSVRFICVFCLLVCCVFVFVLLICFSFDAVVC